MPTGRWLWKRWGELIVDDVQSRVHVAVRQSNHQPTADVHYYTWRLALEMERQARCEQGLRFGLPAYWGNDNRGTPSVATSTNTGRFTSLSHARFH